MSLLAIMEIAGPLLLLGALVYGTVQYRKRSASAKRHTEEATRKLYRDGARQENRDS
jgi:hypothetical protein